MFHAKMFLFDHIYLMHAGQNDMCLLKLTVEYNAAASVHIRINIKLSISFSHSWKTVSLLTYAMPCYTHAVVDFDVFSVSVNT